MFKSKHNLILVLVAALLLGFIGLILVHSYNWVQEEQAAAKNDFQQELVHHTRILEYFFSERVKPDQRPPDLSRPLWNRERTPGVSLQQFKESGNFSRDRARLAGVIPVPGTPLDLITIRNETEILGGRIERFLPLLLGVLGLMLLSGAGIIFYGNTRRLVLQARLETEAKHRQGMQETNEQLQQEVELRRAAEQELHWKTVINQILADLSRDILQQASLEDISQRVLQPAQEITGSRLGYVGYIDPETGCLICPTLTGEVWESCRVADKDVVFQEFKGLFGWVLKAKQSLLSNTPGSDPVPGALRTATYPLSAFCRLRVCLKRSWSVRLPWPTRSGITRPGTGCTWSSWPISTPSPSGGTWMSGFCRT